MAAPMDIADRSCPRGSWLPLVLALALAAPARAELAATHDFGARGTLLTTGALLVGAAEKQTLGRLFDTSTCRWCGTNGFDGWFIGKDYKPRSGARRLSDATLGLSLATALVASGSGFSRHGRRNLGTWTSSVGAAVIAVQISKNVARRRRPYAQVAPSGKHDDNKSFFSGHAGISMAAAVAALEIRKAQGTRARRVWAATALTAAGTTAVLRVAARKHYVTDIVAGAAVGWAAGRLVPKWLEREPREQALQSRLAPIVVPIVSRTSARGKQLGVGPLSGGDHPGVGLWLSWR